MNKRQRNKIKTPAYFIKRLRDCKFGVIRIFQQYSDADPRLWTVLIDPGNTSIYVTCYINKDFNDDIMFEISDGGNLFPRNYSIQTESIEIIVEHLIKHNVPTISENCKFYKCTEA